LETRCWFLPRPPWTVILLFYAYIIAGMTSVATTPSYWLRWGLANFLPGMAPNCDPSDFSLLRS
jgi:hypothetical protein